MRRNRGGVEAERQMKESEREDVEREKNGEKRGRRGEEMEVSKTTNRGGGGHGGKGLVWTKVTSLFLLPDLPEETIAFYSQNSTNSSGINIFE